MGRGPQRVREPGEGTAVALACLAAGLFAGVQLEAAGWGGVGLVLASAAFLCAAWRALFA
jgi:hypothetical protein